AHALPGLILALDTVDLLLRQGQDGPTQRERIREQVHRDQRIARDGLADTRRAIAALRGDELPGPALLEQLVRDTAAATGVRAKLTVAGPARPLPPEIGLTLYRTAQEALTNTAKHAGRGASAQLLLVYQRDAVELATAVADPRPLVRVLIADDQKVVRDGLVSLLGLLPGIVVVGAAVDGDDAVRKAHDLAADVVPMDLNMPRRNGVEAARLLRESRPATSVVVLTTFSDDAWVFAALRSGARLPDQGRGRRRDSPRHHDGRRRPGAARPICAATAARRLCPR